MINHSAKHSCFSFVLAESCLLKHLLCFQTGLSSTCQPSVVPHQRSDAALFFSSSSSFIWITSAFYLISGGIHYFSGLDKLSVAVGGCCWTRGLVLMAAVIGIIKKKKKKSFCLHPLCSCSCLCPSSLDVVQWPRRCWVKGLLGSLWPSTLASLWESWWLCTWRGECQVKRSTLTHTQLTCVTIINHPLLNYHVYYWLFWRSCSSLLLLFH